MNTVLYREAAQAADDLLHGVFTEKALNPLNTRDFEAIVRQLSRALQGIAQDEEVAALRTALQLLDVDWTNLSSEAQSKVIRAANQAMGAAVPQVLPAIDEVFSVEATRIVAATRTAAVRRFSLKISSNLSKTDARTARFAKESQSNFIRDEFSRRREAFSGIARSIVADGLEKGLGRDDISSALGGALESGALSRGKGYWDMVAMVFTNRARTFTQLNAFEEAAVARYRFDALLDESTSEICRLMHNRTFSVEAAAKRIRQVEALKNPEDIRNLQPFARVGFDDEGNQVLFYERNERRRAIAQVDEPGMGQRDAIGRYSRTLSNAQLETAGLTVPPLHGHCRSTIVAEV